MNQRQLATERASNLRRASQRRNRLQGVQRPLFERFPRLAYRVTTVNGSLVLCDDCLDRLRAAGISKAALTGETFAAELCDHCGKEQL
jgi:hypothetical protein